MNDEFSWLKPKLEISVKLKDKSTLAISKGLIFHISEDFINVISRPEKKGEEVFFSLYYFLMDVYFLENEGFDLLPSRIRKSIIKRHKLSMKKILNIINAKNINMEVANENIQR